VGGHDLPAGPEGHPCSIKGLGHTADLIELEQEGVARLHPYALLQAFDVGHKEVVADDYGARQLGGQFGKVVIGLLLEGILQEGDGIGLDQIHIIVNQLTGSETVSVH